MSATFQLADAPTVSPDTVSASSPQDVWFEYRLSNIGDEDGAPVNYYVTVEAHDGTLAFSEFTYLDETIVAGDTNPVSFRIDSATFANLFGDYWVSLRTESGDTIGAAALTVTS